ncbi:MAG: ABC transporter permease, partial [Cytophagales bacterium]|nr:ABC transporter permease [Cytophagales bacterium]
EPNTVVVTEALARKYFPGRNPIGQALRLGPERTPLRVTGVIREMPGNSHFHFDLLASLTGEPETKGTSWMSDLYFLVYLVLDEDANYRWLAAKMPEVVEKYMGPDLQRMMGVSLAEFRRKGNDIGFALQPLTDIHLHSNLQLELEPNGDVRYVYLFSAVALFVLVIAGINFTNLATARAAARAREVGVRKVLGSLREQLIGQFLFESVLLAAIALLLAVGLVYVALPTFNALSGKDLRLDLLAHPLLLPGLPGVALAVGVAAGIYPAFVLSAFRPAAVLKGTFRAAGSKLGVRNALVVFQFSIAIVLIVGTLVAYRQLAFMQHTRVGFDKAQTLVIHDTHLLGPNERVMQEGLKHLAGVQHASVSGFVPVGDSRLRNDVFHPEGKREQQFMFRLYGVDYDYLATMGMQLAAGRNFSPRFATDSTGVLLNETAARALGWGEKALGKKLYRPIPGPGGESVYTVIGVVKDFHHESLHHRIAPLVMTLGGNSGSILVKGEAGDPARLLASAEGMWKRLGTGAPFGYSFLDGRFDAVYRAEQKTGALMSLFARLTVFIACLGLFGLAAYTAEQRRREIGIRKVLGATTGSILLLLSRDFLRLVLLANVVAWPLAWYASRQWLENFAYRIEISPWFFGAAGGTALVVALLTVGFQALKATRVNPAATLKSD